jgi:hypothetical protein
MYNFKHSGYRQEIVVIDVYDSPTCSAGLMGGVHAVLGKTPLRSLLVEKNKVP